MEYQIMNIFIFVFLIFINKKKKIYIYTYVRITSDDSYFFLYSLQQNIITRHIYIKKI